MLLQFGVENYRSFRTQAIFSMEPTEEVKGDSRVALASNGRPILRSASIYGANAAGKTNLLRAMQVGVNLVIESVRRQVGDELQEIVPFRFSEQCAHAPTSFAFRFVEQGKEYLYEIAATRKRIVEERLFVLEGEKETAVFERDASEEMEYHFFMDEAELAPLVARTGDNKAFLAVAAAWNSKRLVSVIRWFQRFEAMPPFSSDALKREVQRRLERYQYDATYQSFLLNLVQKADENIISLSFLPSSSWSLLMGHSVTKDDLKTPVYSEMKLEEESQGTQNLVMISPFLYEVFSEGKILCLDELESSMHPLLARNLLQLFYSPTVNRTGAQLIFTTHMTELLDEGIQRMDQVYLVEKNRQTGSSELRALDEYKGVAEDKMRMDYLNGRFGAVSYALLEDDAG